MSEENKLIEDLFSMDMMVKASAESALYSAGQDIVPDLVRVIGQEGSDKNRGARRICAWVIYKMGSRITDERLRASARQALAAALKDPDEGLRKNAAWGLIPIGGSGERQMLEAASRDPSGDVRDAARYALQQISPRG